MGVAPGASANPGVFDLPRMYRDMTPSGLNASFLIPPGRDRMPASLIYASNDLSRLSSSGDADALAYDEGQILDMLQDPRLPPDVRAQLESRVDALRNARTMAMLPGLG